jgi:hypothetical protein
MRLGGAAPVAHHRSLELGIAEGGDLVGAVPGVAAEVIHAGTGADVAELERTAGTSGPLRGSTEPEGGDPAPVRIEVAGAGRRHGAAGGGRSAAGRLAERAVAVEVEVAVLGKEVQTARDQVGLGVQRPMRLPGGIARRIVVLGVVARSVGRRVILVETGAEVPVLVAD